MCRKFQHQNLVQLYGVVTAQKPIFIVTELMANGKWDGSVFRFFLLQLFLFFNSNMQALAQVLCILCSDPGLSTTPLKILLTPHGTSIWFILHMVRGKGIEVGDKKDKNSTRWTIWPSLLSSVLPVLCWVLSFSLLFLFSQKLLKTLANVPKYDTCALTFPADSCDTEHMFSAT